MLTALKIQFDPATGRRAGDIDPNDPALQCRGATGWQCLDDTSQQPYEIRMIEDARDARQYEGIEGVEVLRGRDAINAALSQLEADEPAQYTVDESVVIAALQDEQHPERGDLTRLRNRSLRDEAPALHRDGVPGVEKHTKQVPKV